QIQVNTVNPHLSFHLFLTVSECMGVWVYECMYKCKQLSPHKTNGYPYCTTTHTHSHTHTRTHAHTHTRTHAHTHRVRALLQTWQSCWRCLYLPQPPSRSFCMFVC